MSAFTAILEPDGDGRIHLPVPTQMRGGRVKVIATIEAVDDAGNARGAKLIQGKFGRAVLVAPPDAPPMTTETIKSILDEER